MGFLNPYTTRAKAQFVKFFENLFAAVNSLHLCQFTAFAYVLEEPIVKYTPKWMLHMNMQYLPGIAQKLILIPTLTGLYNSVTGLGLSQAEFLQAGERIHTLERLMNTREGITRKDDYFVKRFPEGEDAKDLPFQKIDLDHPGMLEEYYRYRGYSSEGLPSIARLKEVGLNQVAQELQETDLVVNNSSLPFDEAIQI